MGVLPQAVYPLFLFFLFVAAPLKETTATTILWTAPAILLAALMIAWAAESAQYFVAQGFALAMLRGCRLCSSPSKLCWLAPADSPSAGEPDRALRLLTGLGWPAIYATAGVCAPARVRAAAPPHRWTSITPSSRWVCWPRYLYLP
jgi:hypothetical protein